MVNFNKIFDTFSRKEIFTEEDNSINQNILINHPLFKLKLFERLVNTHEQNLPTSKNSDPKIKEMGEFMLFNKVWDIIKDFNFKDKTWVEGIKILDSNNFNKSLNKVIKHFIKYEEYEKCDFLHKIQKLHKSS